MTDRSIPVAAALLALLWCAAQAVASAPLTMAVAVAALWATAALAVRRRRAPGLGRGLAVIMPTLAVMLLALLLRPAVGASHLLLQLAIFALLAPAAPLLYALTFEHPPDDQGPS